MTRLIRFMIVVILFIIVCGGVFPNVACAGTARDESQSNQYSDNTSEELFNELKKYIEARTEKVVNKYKLLPSFVKKMFKNEVYLITIDMGDGETLKIKAVKEGILLSGFEQIDDDSVVNPSITVQASEDTVRMLMKCESDRQSFEEGIKALNNGTVEVKSIRGKSFFGKSYDRAKNGVFCLIVNIISESIDDQDHHRPGMRIPIAQKIAVNKNIA